VANPSPKVYANKQAGFCLIQEPQDATNRKLQNKLRKEYFGVAGVIGGPPCQDFSAGGKNKGHTGERGKLIFTYLDIVNKVKPLFLFFVNVAGLVNIKNHQVGFFELYNSLQKDYCIWYEVINSLNLGIPQDRPRLALVGFRKTIVKELIAIGYKLSLESPNENPDTLIFRWPKHKFDNPKAIVWPKAWEFGSGVIRADICRIPDEYRCLTVVRAFEGLTTSIPNQNEYFEPYSRKFQTILEGDTSGKSFKRLHRYRYSPTVAYGNNEVHLHPTKKRRLTVREALRLQTVPDTYILPQGMPLSTKFKLISNGVPVKKSELIATEIRRTLDLYESIL
jgi:DNA (cytosine-5)-methyltransferase 1